MIAALFAAVLCAQAPSEESTISVSPSSDSGSLRVYVGGELGMSGTTERDERFRGFLSMGIGGLRNSVGLLLAFQDARIDNVYKSKQGSQPVQKTGETWDETDILTLGVDFRHYIRPIGDRVHAPFASLTVSRDFLFLRTDNASSGTEFNRTAFGLAWGDEVPVGALFLSGKAGVRCFLMIDNFESYRSDERTTYLSRESRILTSLDLSLGMTYRF